MILKAFIFSVPVILFGLGYLLLNSYEVLGYCIGQVVKIGQDLVCWPEFIDTGQSLMYAGLFSFPIAVLILPATRKAIRTWWKRFAVWFIPLAAVLITLQPESPSAFDPSEVGKSIMTIWLGTLFLIISGLIIFFSNRKR